MIKVGEYVRIKEKGIIGKIEQIGVSLFWLEDGSAFNIKEQLYKHSKNIIDLIEDEDFVVLEYKSPKYRERISRKFEVSKIDNYISFENQHCSFSCKVRDKKIIDDICKNIKIKSIITHEQFESIEYKLEENK